MNTRTLLLASLILASLAMFSQKVSGVYKITDLLKRIDTTSVPLAVNFWASWCKPCVEELPGFDTIANTHPNYKILLVCLDFVEEKEKKVEPLLVRKNIHAECIILDEINGNDYIDKISRQWSGAIPATLFSYKGKKVLIEKKMKTPDILKNLKDVSASGTK